MTDATSTMRVRPEDKRMSILLAGLQQEGDGQPLSEMHLISNFEELGGLPSPVARKDFSGSSLSGVGAALWWIGCAELPQDARTRVLDLLDNSGVAPPQE
jgi:hypothetical protein